MKNRYAKIQNDNFIGFYTEDHQDFNINSAEFIKIDEKKIQELLYEASEKCGEIRILKNGELGIYIKPVNDTNFVNPVFNYDIEVYEEKAIQEEFINAKYKIEKEMRELYKDIETNKVLGFSCNLEDNRLSKLRSKLEYIESKILIKV